MGCTVGIDFDNTIVSYDHIIYAIAVQRHLIRPSTGKSKKDIRDGIRQLPEGELEWQRIQAAIYGPRMEEARLIDGVRPFFQQCRRHDVAVYTISHKTEFAAQDDTRTNLRAAALAWMNRNGFFEARGLGLPRQNVYFESTRRGKIDRISQLGCTHFIDDLEETFCQESFPRNVEGILYDPHRQRRLLEGVKVFATWKEISEHFFGPTE